MDSGPPDCRICWVQGAAVDHCTQLLMYLLLHTAEERICMNGPGCGGLFTCTQGFNQYFSVAKLTITMLLLLKLAK